MSERGNGAHEQALLAARSAHRLVEQLNVALEEERRRSGQIPVLQARIDELEAELVALRSTKVFRYTTGLRRAYAKRLARGTAAG